MNRQRAFTLIELVVIILIIGILAAVVLPRLNLGAYRESGFVQQAEAALRYAQKQAVASGCHVQATIAAGTCTLQWTGAGSTGAAGGCPSSTMVNPTGGGSNFCPQSTAATPNNLPQNITFNNLGCPSAGNCPGSAASLNIGSRTLRVEAETGYIHEM